MILKPFRLAVLFGLTVALAGCSTLGGSGAAPDIFDLNVPAAFPDIRGRTRAQLLVPVPSALDAFATSRVVVRQAGGQIAYYPKTAWADELPALVQLKLVRAFENSGRARAVGRPGESLAIDYQVLVDIRAFELDVAGQDAAQVTLGVKLLDDRTGLVRATKVFEASVPARSDQARDAIAALDAAAAKVFAEIVQWTATAI